MQHYLSTTQANLNKLQNVTVKKTIQNQSSSKIAWEQDNFQIRHFKMTKNSHLFELPTFLRIYSLLLNYLLWINVTFVLKYRYTEKIFLKLNIHTKKLTGVCSLAFSKSLKRTHDAHVFAFISEEKVIISASLLLLRLNLL